MRKEKNDAERRESDAIWPKDIDVSFAQIVGYQNVKEQLKTSYVDLFLYPKQTQTLKLQPVPSLLLYGPPGCGKTMFALATARELSKPLIPISGYFSLSARKIQEKLDLADAFGAIMFMDEAEQFLSRRTGETGRILSTILTWIEGAKKKNVNAFLITATNEFFKLDYAFLRRTLNLFIPPPDLNARVNLLEQAMKEVPTKDIDIQYLAKMTEGFVGSDITGPLGIMWKAKMVAFQRWKNNSEPLCVKMNDLANAIQGHNSVLPKWCFEARKAVLREPAIKELFPEVVKFLENYSQMENSGRSLKEPVKA